MYVALIHVTLDLEPEVHATDRERVLRTLRDRIKNHFGARVTCRTDDNEAVAVAFFDEIHDRVKTRSEEILERIESAGEARIATTNVQILAWFDGSFQETKDSLEESDRNAVQSSAGPGYGGRTIVYGDDDGSMDDPAPRSGFGPIPSRLSRRNMRLPTRK